MTALADDVDAFYLEHRGCPGLENRSPDDGSRIVLVCETCGGVFDRASDE